MERSKDILALGNGTRADVSGRVSIARVLVLWFFLYNYLFPIRLRLIPFLAEIVTVAGGVFCVFYISRRHSWRLVINRQNAFVVLAWVVLFMLGMFSVLINGTYDFSIATVLANYIASFFYAILLIAAVQLGAFGSISLRMVLTLVAYCFLLVAMTAILEALNPSAKIVLAELIQKGGNIDYLESFRASGLAAGGGAALSFALSLGCALFIYLASDSRNAVTGTFFFIASLIVAGATIFVGRTGMGFSAMFYIVALITVAPKRLIYAAIGLTIVYLALPYFISSLSPEAARYYQIHSFEVVNQYLDTGEVNSATSDAVNNMYFLPRIEHWLFGAGYNAKISHGYDNADPGYMRVLLSFGIIGWVVFYSLSIFLIWKSFRALSASVPKGRPIFATLFLCFFIFEYKEPGLYQNYSLRLLFVLFGISTALRASRLAQKARGGALVFNPA